MSAQKHLEGLLKHKGIGAKGSKSLKKDQLDVLNGLIESDDVSLTTKASFWVAFKMLENTEFEKKWLLENETIFPKQVRDLLKIRSGFIGLIGRVIRRENLTYGEAKEGMGCVLNSAEPEYLKGAFLEALRLKRETFDENLGFLETLWKMSQRVVTETPTLIDIADNYDGFNRSVCYTPFLACALSAAGYPTLIHGSKTAAPKFGWTSHQILKKANFEVTKSLNDVKSNIENSKIS